MGGLIMNARTKHAIHELSRLGWDIGALICVVVFLVLPASAAPTWRCSFSRSRSFPRRSSPPQSTAAGRDEIDLLKKTMAQNEEFNERERALATRELETEKQRAALAEREAAVEKDRALFYQQAFGRLTRKRDSHVH